MKVAIVFGTRPECIKLAPVIQELNRIGISSIVCNTGQHQEMLAPFISFFELDIQHNLKVMEPGQDLHHVTTQILQGMRDVLRAERPDVVIVQGDTSTAFSAALAAFYERINVAHVEAGLRTGVRDDPYPEEMNRILIDQLSHWLFAPTTHAESNLLREGFSPNDVYVTGNTIVDALYMIQKDPQFQNIEPQVKLDTNARMILVTAHRRESFGKRFEQMCHAIKSIVDAYADVEVVYPVHLNPAVQDPVYRILGDSSKIHLVEPVGYLAFLKLMESASLILTDSGGVQEEAPTLNKPVLVMRDTTERPEGIERGIARLVGTSHDRIVHEACQFLDEEDTVKSKIREENPYGDGRAAERIVNTLLQQTTIQNK